MIVPSSLSAGMTKSRGAYAGSAKMDC